MDDETDTSETDDGGCPPEAPTLCEGACVDTLSDPTNCGECGVACDTGLSCIEGDCVNLDRAWGEPLLIEDLESGDSQRAEVAMDPQGNAIVVWEQYFANYRYVFSSRYDAAQDTWAEPVFVGGDGDTGVEAHWPKIAMDESGNAICVWQNYELPYYQIYANRYDLATDTWGGQAHIGSQAGTTAQEAAITMDAQGNAWSVWEQDDGSEISIYANRYDAADDTWLPDALAIEDDSGEASRPQIALDGQGNAIAIWSQHDGSRSNILFNRYDGASESWNAAGELLEVEDSANAYAPQVAFDKDDNAIAVWQQSSNIFSKRRDAGTGTWSADPDAITNGEGVGAYFAELAIDGYGNAFAVWYQYDDIGDNIYANRFDITSGSWGDSAVLLETDNSGWASVPQVGADTYGNSVSVWNQNDGTNTNVFANNYNATDGTWNEAGELIVNDGLEFVFNPKLDMNAAGVAIAVWYQWDENGANIWVNQFK